MEGDVQDSRTTLCQSAANFNRLKCVLSELQANCYIKPDGVQKSPPVLPKPGPLGYYCFALLAYML